MERKQPSRDIGAEIKRLLILAIAVMLVVWPVGGVADAASPIDRLILMTEAFPPFNFEAEGRIQGISVDVMERMLIHLNSKLRRADIRLLPWARAYRDALEKRNTVLFLMHRNPTRENSFKWVGPVLPTVYALIAKKSRRIRIASAEEIKKYRIGVVSKDLSEQLLLELGLEAVNIDSVAKGETNLMKLNRDRIDLWNYEVSVAKWLITRSGFDVDDYEAVYVLKEDNSAYYAFHKQTDDEIIQAFQGALDTLKKPAGESGQSGQSVLNQIIQSYIRSEKWQRPDGIN